MSNRARRAFRQLLGAREPLTTGVHVVAGLHEEVTIRRDAWHIPHIEASNDDDAWYGLGWAQGQDRAWQLTSYQHVARGTLAELIGRKGLPVDRLNRRLGFHHHATIQFDAQPASTQAALTCFARGVTDGMTIGLGGKRPHELALLAAHPQPYTATDVLAVMLLFAFNLAANWDAELARFEVLTRDGRDALERVSPQPAAHLPVTTPVGATAGAVADRLAADLALLEGMVPFGGASNNWAVGARRSATGRPLLANDPHLPPSLPNPWYLAHVTTPEWAIAGACLAGAPGVIAGHNGHGAWGVTAGRTDAIDLFLEQVDGTRVREGDDWVQAQARTETFHVRGGRSVEEVVLTTARGPIVGPALDAAPDALSMAATWMHTTPVEGFLALPRAKTFADLQGAFRGWPMQLNIAWADTSGTIGWQLVGSLPRRRAGNGSLPLPGWLPDVGWADDTLDIPDLPFEIDPPIAALATANNPPVADAPGGPELGIDFADGYRLRAILDALTDRDDWTVEAMGDLQRSARNAAWADLRPFLLGPGSHAAVAASRSTGQHRAAAMAAAFAPDDRAAAVATARRLLAGFDGDTRGPGAAIFELATARLTQVAVAHLAPNAAAAMLGRSWSPLAEHGFMALQRTSHLVAMLQASVAPSDDAGGARPWPQAADAIEDALAWAVTTLTARRGPDPLTWAWEEVRPLWLRHPLGQTVKVLRGVVDIGPLPGAGDAHTISQATVVPLDPLANPLAIANLRMVVDVGDWSASRWALAGGQSGNPVSRHYADQVGPWLDGPGIPIPWAADEVAAAGRATLRLLPSQG